MLVIGLTGSIGMGKSTIAERFREKGIAVFDADAEVHRLYESDAAPLIEDAFPGTTVDGRVDRLKLSASLLADPSGFPKLEAIVHPLVRAAEKAFLDKQAASSARFAVLEIPLLFETGADDLVDVTIVGSDLTKFGDFMRTVPLPTSLNLFKMEPLRGYGLLVLEGKLVFAFVDKFFGGNGATSVKLEVTANRVSDSARKRILDAGGKVNETGTARDRVKGIDRNSDDRTPKNLTKKLKRRQWHQKRQESFARGEVLKKK